jgi:hypothetical protein
MTIHAPKTYIVPTERSSPRFGKAFAHGCRGLVVVSRDLRPGQVALFGSPVLWPLLQEAIRLGRTWYYGDHGYFGRGRYFRITGNAYQHHGTGAAGPARFRVFNRPVRPWMRTGRHVLICPNREIHYQLHGVDYAQWMRTVQRTLRLHTDRRIYVRQKGCATPIQRDLADAWAVVTFSSAAALDALIAGVPVFVLAPMAAAYGMGCPDLTKIETPVYPDDREPFLWNLAANQWTLPEIAVGAAYRDLRRQAEYQDVAS